LGSLELFPPVIANALNDLRRLVFAYAGEYHGESSAAQPDNAKAQASQSLMPAPGPQKVYPFLSVDR